MENFALMRIERKFCSTCGKIILDQIVVDTLEG